MAREDRVKFAYLTYDDMMDKLGSGVLNQYDRIIVTDRAFCEYVISPELEAIPCTADENDPTVPSWAKQSRKPTYTPEEVGAVNADNQLGFAEIDRMFAAVFGG
jgi:hypothetical protein